MISAPLQNGHVRTSHARPAARGLDLHASGRNPPEMRRRKGATRRRRRRTRRRAVLVSSNLVGARGGCRVHSQNRRPRSGCGYAMGRQGRSRLPAAGKSATSLNLRRGPVSSPTSVGTSRISHLCSEIYARVARPPGPSGRIPCCAVCCSSSSLPSASPAPASSPSTPPTPRSPATWPPGPSVLFVQSLPPPPSPLPGRRRV